MLLGSLPWGAPPSKCRGAEPTSEAKEATDFLAADFLETEPVDCVWESPATKGPQVFAIDPGVTVRLRGRIDTDAIWSTQSPANEATFGELGDVVGLRRARIGVEGELGIDRRYIAEIDLASGEVVPRDVYFAWGDVQDFGESQLGHMREPFSLEGQTSARYFAFMERSPINVLDPARNWGLGLFQESLDEDSTLGMGLFYAGTGSADLQGGEGSAVDFTGRLTTAPINAGKGEQLLLFGLALTERVPVDGVILINQQPRSPLLELGDSSTSPFVPVIRIPASFQQLLNLQVAAARGPLWSQAEWYGSWIDQTEAGTVFFHGCHADCGYFLTGEHREYDSANGTLGAVKVNRPWLRGPGDCNRRQGWGAWELTARFTYLDFFDADTPPGPSGQEIGIRLPQSTFGVNWYLSDRVRLMFNYSYAVPEEMNSGTSSANILASRLGVFW